MCSSFKPFDDLQAQVNELTALQDAIQAQINALVPTLPQVPNLREGEPPPPTARLTRWYTSCTG